MMTLVKRWGRGAIVVASAAMLLAACGGSSVATGTSATPTATPLPTPSPTPSPTPAPTSAGSPVVLAQTVAGAGTILVAASNSHTVYTFDSDSPGASRCNGGCASTWPPLTIASGTTPTAGPAVTGQLGTITRADGSIQVTYKGLPLYFFHSDTKPGDTKGNYTGWSLVKP